MTGAWVGLGLLALAGFLLGGGVSAWCTSRPVAVVLGIGAVLAVVNGIAWLL